MSFVPEEQLMLLEAAQVDSTWVISAQDSVLTSELWTPTALLEASRD